ncbi:hypothetical protein WMF28_36400 [Sorangium sp. So ce590]|uniref:hypothetical protein n=1 Tax=Sorangium sp. So ce590 TaxID=3133317 RepID=UPI003F5F2393
MRNLTMHLTGAALCALCAFAPAAALAQASPPSAAAAAGEDEARGDNARAAQLYREGNDAFKQKRWSDAELSYLKAWALVRSFDIAANLGEVQLQLKKPRSAATFLSFALRTAPPSAKAEQIARMRHFLDEAKAQVGTVRVRVKNVTDAEVFVDLERVPAEEVKHELYLEPGPHLLVIRRAGYEDEHLGVLAAPRMTETIEPELKPKAEKAPVAAGPGAARPGAASAPGMGDAKTKAPAAGARAEERAGGPRTAVITGGVVAAGVAAGVGTVLAVVAASKWSAASDQRDELRREGGVYVCAAGQRTPSCRDAVERYDDASGLWNAAIWSWIGAGTVGLGTAAYAWLAKVPPERAGSVKVSPMLAVHGGGLVVTSAW